METPNEQGSNTTGRSTNSGRKGTTNGSRAKTTGKPNNGGDGSSVPRRNKSPLLAALGAIAGGALLYTGAKAMRGKSSKGIAGNKKVPITVKSSLLVKRPKAELYAYWRNLENLPNFMSHIEEVQEMDDKRSNWVAEIPGGFGTIEWEAEIIREERNHLLIWRSLPDSEIENSGEVRFEDAEGGKGTIVETMITYRPPAGEVGGLAGKLLNPAFKKVVENDLKQFKKVMERGGRSKRKADPAGRM